MKSLILPFLILLLLAGCASKPSPNLCPTVCDGLVAYYPFYGDATDKSGNGLDGKVIGAELTKDRNGYPNHAYRLDGEDDYLQLDHVPSNGSFTISVLVKFNNVSQNWVTGKQHAWGTIFYSQEERSFWLGYVHNPNQNKLFYSIHEKSGSWANAEITTINPLKYNLYTGVADSSNRTILLYVNGLLVGKDEWDGSVYGVANQAYLGVRSPSSNSEQRGNLDGVIDEVRLYNRALSADEVQELYLFTSAFPPVE